jgi:hypothetical protein
LFALALSSLLCCRLAGSPPRRRRHLRRVLHRRLEDPGGHLQRHAHRLLLAAGKARRRRREGAEELAVAPTSPPQLHRTQLAQVMRRKHARRAQGSVRALHPRPQLRVRHVGGVRPVLIGAVECPPGLDRGPVAQQRGLLRAHQPHGPNDAERQHLDHGAHICSRLHMRIYIFIYMIGNLYPIESPCS